ncbi:M56 family metallopeptidase [Anaerophilus nitritogenes]|uniref:M56 family metallopeptidase n=1 Tax=Anaerophilus nitritogenes TaxID=2498136 RepID=UPI00101D4F35|nr:M56 family metallopeptidase [Anaerophilus nitritogenes]
MELLFKWLISTSIKGSILIGCILIMKHLLKNKLGARWHYYVWFLVLARLVMPFAPESSISFFNLLGFSKHTEMITKNVLVYDPNIIIGWFKSGIQIDGWINDHQTLTQALLQSSIYFKLMIIWIIGLILFSFYTIKTNIRLCSKIKRGSLCEDAQILTILEDCKEKLGIHKDLLIFKVKGIQTPAIFGWIRPRILLPIDIEKKLSPKGLEHIILHELVHFKRKDIVLFWITGILQIIHWFNPIIWYGFYEMRQDCEISCDSMVLSSIGHEEWKNYGQTMITLLESTINSFQSVGVVGFSTQKTQLKRRIKMITLFKKNTYKISIISVILLSFVACTFLTNADDSIYEKKNNLAVSANEVSTDKENIVIEGSDEKENLQEKEMLWPLPDYKIITSTFGKKKHPKFNKVSMHTGIDIAAPKGKTIVAAADGTVIHSEELGAYGNTIIIDHGNGIATLYGHCSELVAKENTTVKMGDEIAKIGSTGASTGPHLHFEIRKQGEVVDPLKYVDDK